MTIELVPRARRASRGLALAGLASGVLGSGRLARRGQEALTLAALAFGMPHGAADTELIRSGSGASRRTQLGLLSAYAATALASTVGIRKGGPVVERAVLVVSALHFGEGELATWPQAQRPSRLGTAMRFSGAATASVFLPAAVTAANRRELGARSGLSLLRDRRQGRRTGLLTALAGASATGAGLVAIGDREAGLDVLLLTGLAVVAPPAVAFASYFGGWHSLRHTARVADALVARGELPAQQSLPGGLLDLGRRSAWAAGVGAAGAAVLVALDPKRASDNAFAAVLGLTVPHMITVAAALSRRDRRDRPRLDQALIAAAG